MNKTRSKHKLEVDFIGGEELTEKEEVLLKDYFARKNRQKGSTGRKNPKQEKAK